MNAGMNYKEITYKSEDKLYKAQIVYPHYEDVTSYFGRHGNKSVQGQLRIYDQRGRLRLKRVGLSRAELQTFEQNLENITDIIMTSEE